MAKLLVHISDILGRKFVYKSKNTATQNFSVLSHASEVKYQVLPKKETIGVKYFQFHGLCPSFGV
jgi:hypothetical protein